MSWWLFICLYSFINIVPNRLGEFSFSFYWELKTQFEYIKLYISLNYHIHVEFPVCCHIKTNLKLIRKLCHPLKSSRFPNHSHLRITAPFSTVECGAVCDENWPKHFNSSSCVIIELKQILKLDLTVTITVFC